MRKAFLLARFGLIAIITFPSACASYHASSKHPARLRGSSVYLQHTGEGSLSGADYFKIQAIDGKYVGEGFFRTDIRVDPGWRSILVIHHGSRNVNQTFGPVTADAMTAGELLLRASLRPGRAYEVTGEGKDNAVRAWVRDLRSGEAVSGVIEGQLSREKP